MSSPRTAAMSSITHDPLVGRAVGLDTHKDFHVAAAKNARGRGLGHARCDANADGYAQPTQWARAHGEVAGFGIAGAGSYGAGRVRYLTSHGECVSEVARPSRQHRTRHGNSDASDAQAAAGAIISGDGLGTPKSADGHIEAIRMLRATRASAVRAKSSAVVALSESCGHRTRSDPRAAGRPEPATDGAGLCTALAGALTHHAGRGRDRRVGRARPARRAPRARSQALQTPRSPDWFVWPAPGCLICSASAPRSPRACFSQLATTLGESDPRQHLPTSVGSHPVMGPRVASSASVSTAAATVRPIGPCTPSAWCACAPTRRAASRWPVAWPKARPLRSSCAA